MPFDSSDHSTKLKIVLEIPSDNTLDSASSVSTVIEATFEDSSVHAWFSVFDRVLKINGFSDFVIMSGATQLAFNEFRDEGEMRRVAKFHDLVLLEDINKTEESSDD